MTSVLRVWGQFQSHILQNKILLKGTCSQTRFSVQTLQMTRASVILDPPEMLGFLLRSIKQESRANKFISVAVPWYKYV